MYNNGDCNMSNNPFTITALADWCEKRPDDCPYDWSNGWQCACAQYAHSLGIPNGQWMHHHPNGSFWGTANQIASEGLHTFGALAVRLREHARELYDE
jgi:hypothetical protein